MNPDVLEKVLSCQRLPSLPAVALRVLELTKDQNVSFKDLAATITNDVALASKVLRTVNSSFYALRKPCSSINQAIVMLGLSAVKTLALGFSLVSSVAKVKAEGFDLQSYWRRSLMSGIAAKCIAVEAKTGSDEECFLGGLLQDVGMIALFVGMEKDYLEVLASAGSDHHQLAREEILVLDVSHPDVGALLATRWKLPAELVMPIKYHERPTAAPLEYLPIVQAVALGNIAADVVGSAEPGLPLRRLYERGEQWFALRPAQCDEIVRHVTQGSREIARLFDLEVGTVPNVDDVLKRAGDQLQQIALPFEVVQPEAGIGPESLDPITGLPGRLLVNQNIVAGFERAHSGGNPLSLALISIDQFEELSIRGETIRNAALAKIAAMLKAHFTSLGGLLCAFDDRRLALIVHGVDRPGCTAALDSAKSRLVGAPIEIQPPGLHVISVMVSISAGLATLDSTTRIRIAEPQALVSLAEQALAAANKAGGNALRVFVPRVAA